MKRIFFSLLAMAALVMGACERHSASELERHGHGDSQNHAEAAEHGKADPHAPAPHAEEPKAPAAGTTFTPGGPSSDPHAAPAAKKEFFPQNQ